MTTKLPDGMHAVTYNGENHYGIGGTVRWGPSIGDDLVYVEPHNPLVNGDFCLVLLHQKLGGWFVFQRGGSNENLEKCLTGPFPDAGTALTVALMTGKLSPSLNGST